MPTVCVGGQQADAEGGQAHQHQAGDENGFAADLVAQVPADRRRRAGGPAKPTPRVAKDSRVPVSGSPEGKKSWLKYNAAAVP